MTGENPAAPALLRPLLVAGGAGLAAGALAGIRVPAGPVGSPDWTVALGAVTLFRWAAVGLATYVASVAMLALVAGLRPSRLLRLTVAVTPIVLRRLVFGSSVALAATAPMGSLADAAPPERPPPTMVLLERPPVDRSEPTPNTIAAAPTWTVRPGEHFWSITAAVLRDELGRPPSEREITRRWLQLIEANRSRLVHPDDPDLLLPGQILLVPPP